MRACFAVAVVYVLLGKLGLSLAFVNASATAVWPPTGVAIGALLLGGVGIWPGVFLGAFLTNITTSGAVLASAGIATGNTLEAVVATALVTRHAGGKAAFERAESVVAFALIITLIASPLAAFIGVSSLSLGGLLPASAVSATGLTWWLGDAAGGLLIAPAVISWGQPRREPMRLPQALEALMLLAVALFITTLVFGDSPWAAEHYALEFLCLPALAWAAVRLEIREASLLLPILATVAVIGTRDGTGPFAVDSENTSLLLLQAFMGVASLTTLLLAAAVSERRDAETKLWALSTRDALTGLANYRYFEEILSREVADAQRSGKNFALILLDVDGLKRVNDTLGHLVGNEMLCRLARALQDERRRSDLPARIGGDEFAILLPYTDFSGATEARARLQARLARDGGSPPLRASLGIAVFPVDGSSAHELTRVADERLYSDKRTRQLEQQPV